MDKENCKLCRFFDLQNNQTLGQCRRYPTYMNRHQNEWCGEHNPILPTTITLPKVDLELGVVMNPAIDQTEKKKLGRPKLSGRQIP